MFFKLFQTLNYKKNFPYFICTPLVYGIGAASEHIAMASAYAKRSKKKLLIIKLNIFKKLLKYQVCNNALFDSLIINGYLNDKKSYVYKLINFLIQAEFLFRRIFALACKFFKIDIRETFRFALIGVIDLYSENKNKVYEDIHPLKIEDSIIDLTSSDIEECKSLFKKYNLENKKIVCLHVRDQNYYNDSNRRIYRNSNINNYKEAIKYLIDKNYLVVRIGDKSAKKMDYQNRYFIDYPFTKIKSEIMDLFLIKECNFYIGTPSGPMDTAYLFKKPLLLTNLYDIFPSYLRKKIDRGVFRKIIRKSDGKSLSLNEFVKLGIKYHQTEVYIDDIDFIENTSSELLDATKEFCNNIEKKKDKKINFEFDKKQIAFNSFISNRLEEIYNEDFLKNNVFGNNFWKKSHFLKITKRFKSCEGTYTLSTLKDFYC